MDRSNFKLSFFITNPELDTATATYRNGESSIDVKYVHGLYRVVKKFVRLKKSILKFIFSDLFYSVLIGNSLLYQSLHLSDRSSLRIQLKTFFSIFYAKSHRLN